MHVEVRKHADVVIVDIQGKITAGLGDELLRDTVTELLDEGWKKILLNLSAVSFMDSAGVGELVAALKKARRQEAELKLLSVGEKVQSTLYIARLLPVFELFQDEREALSKF